MSIVQEGIIKEQIKIIQKLCENNINSVPKSKIEDKIKELKKRMKEERKKTERKSKYLVTQEYMYRISGLEELLKEE